MCERMSTELKEDDGMDQEANADVHIRNKHTVDATKTFLPNADHTLKQSFNQGQR